MCSVRFKAGRCSSKLGFVRNVVAVSSIRHSLETRSELRGVRSMQVTCALLFIIGGTPHPPTSLALQSRHMHTLLPPDLTTPDAASAAPRGASQPRCPPRPSPAVSSAASCTARSGPHVSHHRVCLRHKQCATWQHEQQHGAHHLQLGRLLAHFAKLELVLDDLRQTVLLSRILISGTWLGCDQ